MRWPPTPVSASRLRRLLLPSYGSRANAAQAMAELPRRRPQGWATRLELQADTRRAAWPVWRSDVTIPRSRDAERLPGPASTHLLPGSTSCPRAARAIVAAALATFPEDTIQLAELLTSELVTNVHLPAHTALSLRIETGDDFLRVIVEDSSHVKPQVRDADVGMTTGRGLAIINELSSGWGWELTPAGKFVWFELPRSEHAA